MIKTYLTFSLPEDQQSDQIVVLEAREKDGTYSPHVTLEYSYGQNKVEVELDKTKWYKIQFFNSKTGDASQTSAPVYAGNYSHGAPALFVSSNTDGANYATTQDVYDYSGLTPEDVPQARVSRSLKKARANIDYRVEDLRSDSFLTYEDKVQNRKYNAALQLIHEAEICLALGHLYDSLSDRTILNSMREGDNAPSSGSVSIGGTSVAGDSLGERSESIIYLATLASKYRSEGTRLLDMLDPNNVPLVSYQDHVRSPKFKYPFHGWPK